jgi:hypothetical protein
VNEKYVRLGKHFDAKTSARAWNPSSEIALSYSKRMNNLNAKILQILSLWLSPEIWSFTKEMDLLNDLIKGQRLIRPS